MASERHSSELSEAAATDGDSRQALIARILASPHFEKSARLRDFLGYVCDHAVRAPEGTLSERDIGCAVFGRAPDYDTDQDNIVRVNASQVRKRLDAYFAHEGQAEPLLLELPKGHYAPVFRARLARSDASGPSFDSRHRLIRIVWALAVLSGVLLLALAATLLSRAPAAGGQPAATPAMKGLWSRLLGNGQATAIVLTDSSLGLVQDLLGQAVPLSEYIRPHLWLEAPSLALHPDAQLAARLAAKRHYTDMASVHAARYILALSGISFGAFSGSGPSRVTLHFARDFSLREMKSGNAILLGSRRTNPWVEAVENRMAFHYGFDAATRQAYFENRRPQRGELPVYANDRQFSYCQIVLLPNAGGAGNILVVSGTDPEGTQTGAEFLTTGSAIASLSKRLAWNGQDPFPYFEALLRFARTGGLTGGSEIVAARHAAMESGR